MHQGVADGIEQQTRDLAVPAGADDDELRPRRLVEQRAPARPRATTAARTSGYFSPHPGEALGQDSSAWTVAVCQSTSCANAGSLSSSSQVWTATSGTRRAAAASKAKGIAASLSGVPSIPTTTGRARSGRAIAPRTTTTGHAERAATLERDRSGHRRRDTPTSVVADDQQLGGLRPLEKHTTREAERELALDGQVGIGLGRRSLGGGQPVFGGRAEVLPIRGRTQAGLVRPGGLPSRRKR